MFQAIISTATFLIAAVTAFKIYSYQRKLKRRTDELELQLKDAEAFLLRHGKLANEVAHEIKNPITAILCSAEALDLMLGPTLAEDHRKTLSYIKEYGDNLLRLVSNFIDVSRADTGNVSNNPEPTEIAPVIESVTGLLSASAERKDISIKQFCPDAHLKAVVDGVHLKQILFNLIHNAIKYTPRRGEVQVHVESDFPNPFVRIAVRDNGYGIPAPKLSTLFDPYSRFDTHASMAYPAVTPGVGLGLALCKRLVELAGGELTVESQLNVGTRFEFTLPLAHEPERSKVQDATYDHCSFVAPGVEQPLLGQNFLILNKAAENAAPVRQLIIAWGGCVDLVNSAEAAIIAVQSKKYQAVMVDEELDAIDLSTFTRILKAGAANNESTTIILAGDRFHLDAEDGGLVDKVISKPFNGKVLLDALLSSHANYQEVH